MRPVGKYPKSPQKLTPNCHKENSNGEALLLPSPCDKRQRVGRDVFGVKIHAGSPKVRVRQALNDANAAVVEAASDPNGVAGGNVEVPVHEFSKAEIEELLGFKIKSKNKFDYKGKCEQMLEYIKKLKACIRWTQTREETLVSEKEDLEKQLQDTVDQHNKKEECFRSKEKELEQTISELQNVRSSLQDILSKIEAEKEALIEAKDKETEARLAAERMQKSLTEELDKAQKEISNINQQVASVQDINKRLQEYNSSLQLYNSKLQSDAAVSAESIAKIQKEKSTMMETLSSLRGHSAALQEQLNNHKSTEQELLKKRDALLEEIERLRTDLQRVTDDRDQQATQAQALTIEVSRYKECTGKTASELERLSTVTSALEESNSTQNEHIRSLCMKLEIANRKLELAESSSMQHRLTDEEQRQKIEDLQKRLEEAELQISEGELVRRKLHNTILELKGNIRVFCRVRPLLADEESLESAVVQYPTSSENNGRGVDLVQGQGQKYSFIFDKVFPPASSQKEVFEEISQLIQSALDGYKVCIFAYGQTGSGKTHTMLGRSDIHDQRGIIPRSLEQIFKSSQSLVSQGWKFKMQASMLEIYNESIRDLLVSSKSSNCDGSSNKQYSIKHDQTGNTIVSDLTVVDVTNWSEVSSLLQRASQSRSVGKTAMNEQSSRSHCVFTLRISGVNEGTEQQVQGVLNLIDLAGSERLSRSGATGDRLKETQAINKSLSCLGDVILAIANKEPHVPFRNSKLTYLLQPCLGGDSKTLMFVNISPDAKSLNESLCSLRFAAKVNACDIGVPRRQPQARAADST